MTLASPLLYYKYTTSLLLLGFKPQANPSSSNPAYLFFASQSNMVRGTQVMNNSKALKFLCSYAGKILPRSTDGKLRYVGGLTRVFSVDRSISFAELMVKLGEFCGFSVTLRCQLPNGDLETLISIKSDDDLANLLEEYDRAASNSKIRAILTPPASLKQVSPPPSMDFLTSKQPFSAVDHRHRSRLSSLAAFGYPVSPTKRADRSRPCSPPYGYPVSPTKLVDRIASSSPSSPTYEYPVSSKVCYYPHHMQENPRSLCSVPHKNYWH